jgi:hypothetical protein
MKMSPRNTRQLQVVEIGLIALFVIALGVVTWFAWGL